ncbi:MAG: RNA-directed DNA polymerase [Roseburia sp.]|nr:RNA-directed DNA polymerase [Roseburia sp.]
MLREVANKLYELFVVNRNATAIQLKDGKYITKYTKITENDIYCMLKEKKSLGSYQQLYKSPYVKWVCFDFDCKDKENPNLQELYNKCTLPLNNFLRANNISFVNEFSGRRGIHTWIIFDDYVKKGDAYKILNKIKNAVVFEYDTSAYALDEFPATSGSKGNVLGKQVKVPLSFHSCGKQSYLFFGEYKENNYCNEFYKEQLLILNTIKKNKLSDVIRILQLEDVQIAIPYKKMYITESLECNAEQVVNILSQTEVYRQLFERLLHGQALLKDWFVMLGTLGKIEGSSDLLCDVFKYCPDFSEKETKQRISQFGYKYFPATFSYLYNLYDLDIEEKIDPNENGLQYLIRHLDQNIDIHNWDENEKTFLKSSEYTLKKEISYLFTNDEVPVVSIYLDLLHMTSYDSKKIDVTISKISKGGMLEIEPRNYHVFERIESESKTRKMVSLSAYDRVLTSHLALNLFYGMSRKIKSYSYNPNYLSENDMFFHWYNSWGNYLGQIRKFLDFDMYENMQVITLDISRFYDSIDFLGIYRLFDNYLNALGKNILKELVSYNEKIMRRINGSRKGVPQGPAYARLIAETFLGILVEKVIEKLGNHEERLFIYRYVDDIVIFHDETLISQNIYDVFYEIFSRYGLTLNQEKSKIYGKIRNLSEEQRCEILRTNQFQYGLRISDYSYLVEDKYIQKKVSAIIAEKEKFDISNIAFFFSVYTDVRAKKYFFNMYSKDIFSCKYGRGSGYSLFYKYVLSNEGVLEKCIEKSLFELIPINSINFSCCLVEIYYAYKNNILTPNNFKMLLRTYIHRIKANIEKVEREEDKSIILSLASQEEK